jgi:hypothetical protein
MQGAARLLLHGLGHEGRVHIVLERRLAHRALEHEHLVRQGHGIAVAEVDFHLRGAVFVDQRIDVEFLRLGVVVHVLDEILELRDRVDAVGQARGLLAPAATHRWLELVVRIGVARHQIELHLRRDHRA